MTRRSRRAFTLIEVLLSMALVALMLVSLNTFVFSMSELWGTNSDSRLFDQHVHAVTRYLQQQMRDASLAPAASANATPIGVTQITPANGPQDYLITYMLLGGTRILNWADRPLPEVMCSLQLRDGKGLFLLWHSDLEMHYATDPPRETLISPFITTLGYDYFDTDFNHWTTETTMRKDNSGNTVAPARLHLLFVYRKLKSETIVDLPTTPQGVPNTW